MASGENFDEIVSQTGLVEGELVWYSRSRQRYSEDEWENEDDNEKASYHYSFKKYEDDIMPREYKNLSEYLCEEIGASSPKNVCALAVDLAKANGMTMAKLFKVFEGSTTS